MTRIAVVVPAHDEAASITACLHSIATAALAVAPVPVEIIVVADACADDTAAFARDAGATVLTTTARNVGRARAAGMRHALRHGPDGLWLATTDADSRVPPGWLTWQLRHADAGAGLLAGTVVVHDWQGWPADLQAAYDTGYHDAVRGTAHDHAHGANLGISADAYQSAGGFRPLPHSEDRDLIDRMSHRGARVVTDTSCPVITSSRRLGRAPHGFAAHLITLAAAAPPYGKAAARDVSAGDALAQGTEVGVGQAAAAQIFG
ncbi:glycosyltransferase involved in cell wall biosynthesis [Actinoplanes lutulentus]|uniref:4,4'-diaponeurosporenoate glycosyltransferase n=1 Tax=Actinoplanes lutulentus TaxID=1287878 RepID=A0A327ZG11_9ACTN|nr:glycosyltransferase [Actinoplanes lutulentus]MBB2947189.1 glycosyltransferase involved in cell wall biosynthesis [Actinoplanes lutulentus]RAK36464.1 glycosyl transferase family 2 [Actinoplanes lutulentus]